jgi:hypothetical protein
MEPGRSGADCCGKRGGNDAIDDTVEDLHALDLAFDPDTVNDPDHVEVCGTQAPAMEEIMASSKRLPIAAWDNASDWIGPLEPTETAELV